MGRTVNRVERLRRLEEMLSVPGASYSMMELAHYYGVNKSTISRDLNDLESNGIPLIEQQGRYAIDRRRYLSNVRLSVGESLMLYLALRYQTRRLTHLPESMVSTAEKLTFALRHPISDELARMVGNLRQDRPDDKASSRIWEVLIDGWFDGITVRITYQKFTAEQPTIYKVQPYLFEPAPLSEGVYMIGYSLSHQALRTLKIERILHATLTTIQFERPTEFNVETLLQHAWGVWYGKELHEVQLRFRDPAVARRVKETLWHPSQVIEDQQDGGIIWSVQVAGLIELVPWIRGWGPDVEVLAPIELRERIADEMRRAATLYTTEEE